MKRAHRIAGLATALCGAAALVWFDQRPAQPAVQQAAANASLAQPGQLAPARRADLARDPLGEARYDPFAPPLPAAPATAAAPASAPAPEEPKVPPFPYRYFGSLVGPDGTRLTYLARGEKMIPIRLNQVLDTEYRVDAISESAITVTYLALNEKTVITTDAKE